MYNNYRILFKKISPTISRDGKNATTWAKRK